MVASGVGSKGLDFNEVQVSLGSLVENVSV